MLNDAPAAVCLNALALWRHSVQAGSVRAAPEPIVGLDASQPAETTQSVKSAVAPPQSPTPFGQEWESLGSLDVDKRPRYENNTPIAPVELGFPDGSRVEVRYWVNVATSVAEWLVENDILTEANCPVKVGTTRYAIATSPHHANDRPMQVVKCIGPLYMEADYTGRDLMRNAKAIIERVGQEPSRFKLRFP